MAAYRKLLVHNEVTCGNVSNCQNDVTKILDVSSRIKRSGKAIANPLELEMLRNYDFEHPSDGDNEYDDETYIYDEALNDNAKLSLHGTAYLAALVEKRVIQELARKGTKTCFQCIDIFTENPLTNDDFVTFIARKKKDIVLPCKSTIEIMQCVDKCLEKYANQKASFQSTITHIVETMKIDRFYAASIFDENHDHRTALVNHVVSVYMNIKSKNASKLLTRQAQKKLLRHENLKSVHQQGQ